MATEAKKEAAQQGVSLAELVGRALARVLRDGSSDEPWMRLAGIIEDPSPEASQKDLGGQILSFDKGFDVYPLVTRLS